MNMGQVLIVGGGIGGLPGAIALRQNGLPVEIIERDPNCPIDGVGMAVDDAPGLANGLTKATAPETVFDADRPRRDRRARHVAETASKMGGMQRAKIPPFDVGALSGLTIGTMCALT